MQLQQLRGSFKKIVKRGRKLTVKKFGGASLVLLSHIISSKGGQDSDKGGRMPPQMKPCSCIIQTASQSTHIVSCPPQWLCACLDATGRLPWGGGVPELDGGVMATRGQLPLIRVAPV